MKKLIGRLDETKLLTDVLTSPEAEMVSVIGRRRVGKTFLIRSVYEGKITFEISGIQKGTQKKQLRNFKDQLEIFSNKSIKVKVPIDWQDAFVTLREYLKLKLEKSQEKIVLFFDEVPWLAGKGSDFLQSFGYFWNTWASQNPVVVVICGSSASWMIRKVLRDKGGLHNRVTKRIRVKPFTLAETEEYLQNRGIFLDRYHILLIYMSMGGIPHYLKEISGQQSAIQNINNICFSENGLLKEEFLSLYPALFDHADYHLAIIRVLATKHYGMLRKDIVKAVPFNDSGRISKVLEELIDSGFVSEYLPFGNKVKDKIFRLSDEYTLFYLRFIEKSKYQEQDIWNMLSQTAEFKTWTGYAFENICLKHIPQIKKGLGISGIYSTSSTYLKSATKVEKGIQIDLLIDRNDSVVNLVEIKFYNTEYSFTKADSDVLRDKMRIFKTYTETKKMLNWICISPFGVKENANSQGIITQSFDLNVFFEG
jgi:uncharacterized protein